MNNGHIKGGIAVIVMRLVAIPRVSYYNVLNRFFLR